MGSDCCCRRPPGFRIDIPGEFPSGFPGEFAEAPDEAVVVPPPLLNFAPGQAVTEYGTDQQLPLVQPFYGTSAAMLAAGVTAAPRSIYLFDEATGNILDRVNTYHLIPQTPAQVFYRRKAVGFWDGSSFFGKYCLTQSGNSNFSRLEPANLTDYDFGTDSFCIFIIYSVYRDLGVSGAILGNTNGAAAEGFMLTNNGDLRLEDDLGNSGSSSAPFLVTAVNSYYAGGWRYAFIDVNRSTAVGKIESPFNVGADIDLTGWGNIDSTDKFSIGATAGYVNNRAMYYLTAYMAVWQGVNAESISANWAATNRNLLWKHGIVANTNIPAVADSGKYDGVAFCYVGDEAGFGRRYAPVAGEAAGGTRQFPWQYNAELTNTSKIGGMSSATAAINAITRSTAFTAPQWTAVTGTATGSGIYEAPDGSRPVAILTTSGADARVEHQDMTCAPGQIWDMGLCYKRAAQDDVSITVIAWDDNANAIIDSANLTATDQWQWYHFDGFTIPGGCVDVQMHILINYNAGLGNQSAIFWGMSAFRDSSVMRPMFTQVSTAAVTQGQSPTYITQSGLAGEYIKSDQGEIEVVFVRDSNYAGATEALFDTLDAGAGSNDRRLITINTSKQIAFSIYTSAGALIGTVVTAAIADLTTRHVAVARWDRNGLPSGNKYEVSIDGAAAVGANPAAWTAGTNLVTVLSIADGTAATAAFSGTIESTRVWEDPR